MPGSRTCLATDAETEPCSMVGESAAASAAVSSATRSSGPSFLDKRAIWPAKRRAMLTAAAAAAACALMLVLRRPGDAGPGSK